MPVSLSPPVVRIGSNPGPGGLRLEGYRGLDDRQAVISAYDGGTVAIAYRQNGSATSMHRPGATEKPLKGVRRCSGRWRPRSHKLRDAVRIIRDAVA